MIERWQENFECIDSCVCVSGSNIASRHHMDIPRCGCKPQRNEERTCWNDDCINYQTQTECVHCSQFCSNRNFQDRSEKKLEVRNTAGKGFGLFANEHIKRDSFIIEFTGEIISHDDYCKRMNEKGYSVRRMYFLSIKSKTYLDCTKKGSIARFINHSCEPNCRLEVWNVSNVLRIGVFSMRDINVGEELSFDYKWEPSSFPPTKCLCHSPTCRGYIEIFKSEEEKALITGKGTWVHCSEIDETSVLPGDFLIGKKVKVWLDGNEDYAEGKVLERISDDQDLYSVIRLSKKHTEMFTLHVGNRNWYYFDEFRLVTVVKKKCGNLEEVTEPLILDLPVSTSISKSLSDTWTPVTMNADEVHRDIFKLHRDVLSHLISSGNAKPLQMQHIIQFFSTEFDAIAKPMRVELNDPALHEFEIFGERHQLQSLRRAIKNSMDLIASRRQIELTQSQGLLQSLQSVIFTRDWRINPIIDEHSSLFADASISSNEYYRSLSACANQTDMVEYCSLPRFGNTMPNDLHDKDRKLHVQSPLSLLSMNTLRATENYTLFNLRKLCIRLNFSHSTCLHALALQHRYFPFCNESMLKETPILLAAILFLTLKARGVFRIRMMPKIMRAAYCQVFAREESEVGSSSDSYLPKLLQKEREICNALGYDLFVPDLEAILFHHVTVLKLSEEDRAVARSIYSKSCAYVSTLYINHSVLLHPLTPEIIHIACFFLVYATSFHQNSSTKGVRTALQRTVNSFQCPSELIAKIAILFSSFLSQKQNQNSNDYLEVKSQSAIECAVAECISRGDKGKSTGTSGEANSSSISGSQYFSAQSGKALIFSQLPILPRLSKGTNVKTRLHPLTLQIDELKGKNLFQEIIFTNEDSFLFHIEARDFQTLPEGFLLGRSDFDVCKSNDFNIRNESPDILVFSGRTISSVRSILREREKLKILGFGDFGVYREEASELFKIQHANYIQSLSADVNNLSHIGKKYIIQPFNYSQLNEAYSAQNLSTSNVLEADKASKGTRKLTSLLSLFQDCPEADPRKWAKLILEDSKNAVCPLPSFYSSELQGIRFAAHIPVAFTLQDLVSANIRPYMEDLRLCFVWTHQFILAMDHLSGCGMDIKWIDLSSISFTYAGDLLLTSLSSATISIWDVPHSNPIFVKKKESNKGEEEPALLVPHYYLHLAAPEVLLGSICSSKSTVYCTGLFFFTIVTGQLLMKNGKDVEKQFQYIYDVLGTPKALHYNDFNLLPYAKYISPSFKKEDGSVVERHSHVVQALERLLPPQLSKSITTSPGEKGQSAPSDPRLSSLLKMCCALVPKHRAPLVKIFETLQQIIFGHVDVGVIKGQNLNSVEVSLTCGKKIFVSDLVEKTQKDIFFKFLKSIRKAQSACYSDEDSKGTLAGKLINAESSAEGHNGRKRLDEDESYFQDLNSDRSLTKRYRCN